ncbi:MAG: aminoacyl-histidine dipeptidase [Prevotellaceae bacterium]|nr:aminoacyl-histidine dipeptidase [Candidatus Colivivens equi]
MTITDLQPKLVWESFHSLTQIPRPSGHTEAVAAFLVKFAKEHGAKAKIDPAGNVYMQVPATKGYENRQMVILQAHMDMVPQKAEDSSHDFEKDPIQTVVDGDWIKANKTTLGADDGMGIATAMAIIADKNAKHGPLEVLITRDEETGMYGANELPAKQLKGNLLLNLDSETEGEITIGCAGGMDISATMKYKLADIDIEDAVAFKLSINGLLGGHSGLEINESRGNANKLMARVLFAVVNTINAQLCSWHGGNMRNAIPRTGNATLIVPASKVRSFKRLVTKCEKTFNAELKDIEKEPIVLTVEKTRMPRKAIPEPIQMNLINAVMVAHDGVLRFIPTIPDIVETSVNLSIINIEKGKAEICMLARSATNSMKQFLCNELIACFSMAGMKVRLSGGYSGWQPNTGSALVALMSETYKKMFNEEPKVLVVHAGLECGIIGPKYPDMDMASIGPTLRSPHTPNERCYIPSVEKFYKYVLELLKNIPDNK